MNTPSRDACSVAESDMDAPISMIIGWHENIFGITGFFWLPFNNVYKLMFPLF